MSGLRGRPRDTALDTAIANATESVLLSHGYSAVNIDRIAKMAGTTRAAIYRRAKTPGELVVALLVSRFGLDPASDTGNLRDDLKTIQELQRSFFTDPMVQAGLTGVCAWCVSTVRPLPASCSSTDRASGGTRARCKADSTSGGSAQAGAASSSHSSTAAP